MHASDERQMNMMFLDVYKRWSDRKNRPVEVWGCGLQANRIRA